MVNEQTMLHKYELLLQLSDVPTSINYRSTLNFSYRQGELINWRGSADKRNVKCTPTPYHSTMRLSASGARWN